VGQVGDQLVRQAPVAVGFIGLGRGALADAMGGLDQAGKLAVIHGGATLHGWF
jgi:hypothetical protein